MAEITKNQQEHNAKKDILVYCNKNAAIKKFLEYKCSADISEASDATFDV